MQMYPASHREVLLKTITGFKCIFLFAVIMAVPAGSSLAEQGKSPFDPAAAGIRLSGIVECGRGYTTHELYDMKITLLEVIRGTEAWDRLKKANTSNKPPEEEYEYILARVKYEYYARGKPGLCVHKLRPEQFIACSSDGEEYPATRVILPEPGMQGDMKAGDTVEGWVSFLVPRSDKTPLMYYTADSGKAVMHGGNIWFKLY